MKSYLIAFLLLSLAFGYSQEYKTPFKTKFNYSQKFGLDIKEGDYLLTVQIKGDTLFYNTREGQKKQSLLVTKKTDKYVIAKTAEGNYSFYDIEKHRLYVIDYFMSRYILMAYGEGYSEIKQTINKMMTQLKDGKSQKQVIQFLIEETSFDF